MSLWEPRARRTSSLHRRATHASELEHRASSAATFAEAERWAEEAELVRRSEAGLTHNWLSLPILRN